MILELLSIIAPVAICALIGWSWSRSGVRFDSETASHLVLYVGAPCLIFNSLVTTGVDPAALTRVATLAAIVLTSAALFGALLLRFFGFPRHTYLGPMVFGNSGNLGLPVCLFAFGEAGKALGVAFFTVSFVAHSLVGDFLFAGQRSWKPLLRSPLFAAALVSILFLALDLPVPRWLGASTKLLGDLTIPLMLITLGVSLSRLRLGDLRASLGLSVLRMGLGFLLGWAIATAGGLSGIERGVLILEASVPVGVLNYLFAQKYERSPAQVASLVLVSTLLSLLTIPALLAWL